MPKTHRMGVSNNKALQSLMTGLIYPAVLGTILFSVLPLVEANLRAVFSSGQYVFSSMVALKFMLLLVTLAFYGCDYLYAIYTRDFLPRFFFFDIIFVICLYATVQVIDVKDAERLVGGWLVALFYLIFMLLYRSWDRHERDKCVAHPEKCMPEELNFYEGVLVWERWSIRGLLPCIPLLFFWQNRITLLVFIVILGIVTLFFWKYAWKKKSFYFDPEAAPANPMGGLGELTSQIADQKEVPNSSLNRTDTALSRGPAG